MFSQQTIRRFRRAIGLPLAACFTWTFCLGPAVQAATIRTPRPPGRVRKLTRVEMRRVTGATYPAGTSPDPGTPYPWDGKYGSNNTCNGNKLTSVPLVSWTAKGGLPVAFTLNHNSKSTHNDTVGQKWTHSFDVYVYLDMVTNLMTVHWGDDRAYQFTQNATGTWVPPAGIHDTITMTGSGLVIVEITTPQQVKYHFEGASGSGVLAKLTSISDPNGNSISLTYANGLLTTVTDATNRSLTLAYDVNNRISTVTDPLNRQWALSYNTSAELTQVSWPILSGTIYTDQFAYDAAGNHNIVTHTDRRAQAWTASYNADSSVAWEKDPLLNQTSYTYNAGNTVVTDPNGRTLTTYSDSSCRNTSVVDALGSTVSYSYDTDNNRIQVTDKRGKIWQYGYDSQGNQTSATDPLLHTVNRTYNGRNRLLTVTDALSHQVVNTYDTTLNWRLTQTQKKDSVGTVLSTTSFTYNVDGTVATKTDSNNHQTAYGYNSNGDLTSLTTPNNRAWAWGYNGLGVKTSRTDALLRQTTYTLDNWLRTTTTTYPDTTTKTFSYDACGNLTGWTDGGGTWSRTYDNANRLTRESLNGTARFTYAYDATGKRGLLASLTDAANRTFTYSYTSRNELASAAETDGTSTLTTSYTYDPNGNETNVSNPNGTSVTRVFDDAGRLTSVTNKNSSNATLSSFSYGYNNDNERTSLTEADGSAVSYGYDAAHRLTSESRTGTNPYSKSYTVDGTGNRTAQTVGGVNTTFTLDTDDELTATSGGTVNSYSYNANGEQTGRTLSGTSYTLAYDYDGQLTSVTQGATVTSFTYDALGHRLSRTAGGTTTQFLSSGSRVYLESVGSTVSAKYGYGNALVHKDGEYPLFDGQGNERTVTNGSQTVTGSINYDAFGQTVGSTGSSSSPYMYGATSGYESQGDAGLLHVGARYYDAQVGRFTSRDTELDQHPYLYCDHDPVDSADPSGHESVGDAFLEKFREYMQKHYEKNATLELRLSTYWKLYAIYYPQPLYDTDGYKVSLEYGAKYEKFRLEYENRDGDEKYRLMYRLYYK